MVKRAGGALLLSVEIDRDSARPVSTQLYMALRDLILSGAFAAGDRLPASRTLARDLALSRTTVIDAFERLIAEGLIESRVGSGTFVSDVLSADRPKPLPGVSAIGVESRRRPLACAMNLAVEHFGERQRLPYRPRAFTTALPDFDMFPMAQWAQLSAKHWRGNRSEVMGYGEPCGHLPLRRAIASHLRANRGIGCEPEQIFIVAGAQQAFHLIGSVLLNPGDKAWFENPGAIGARNGFVACGADLVPVPVDDEGLCVEKGLAQAADFRLAFVTPSHQQPLGSVMSLARRFALLRAAEDAGAWIVEDDYDGEFFFGGQPLPTLKSVDTTGLVLYVGTFSKSLFPSLRLGYLLAPPALVDIFEKIMGAFLHGVPSYLQAVVAEFIDEGHFATHLRRMRRVYAERHEALREAARAKLGGTLDLVPARSGLHTVGHLAAHLSELEVARIADKRGVIVSPIARFAVAPISVSGLVLGFGSVGVPQIKAGIDVLAGAMESLSRRKAL
ncbi:MAG TPA: PLP-dependent aminotransferase family protein [Alphaproteobacteria bacterium]|nr:PLP-dependent aminotransferase family protein [Alphaproteobacteria bacterium]